MQQLCTLEWSKYILRGDELSVAKSGTQAGSMQESTSEIRRKGSSGTGMGRQWGQTAELI